MKNSIYPSRWIFILAFVVAMHSLAMAQKATEVFTDPRDRTRYEIIQLGNQWWFAQNLSYNCEGSYFYNKNARNKDVYGRLYTWDAALNACPDGWHLPSDDEWKVLEQHLGLPEKLLDETEFRGTDQGKKLTVKGNSGFNATLAGWRSHEGEFTDMDVVATFWTSSSFAKTLAWGRGIEKDNDQISRLTFGKTIGFSVRCVKNQ